MIEWIKTIFKDRPDTSTPITAEWLNNLQDYMMQIGLIRDYIIEQGSESGYNWTKYKSGRMTMRFKGSTAPQLSSQSRNSWGFYQVAFYLPDYPIKFVGTPSSSFDFGAGTTNVLPMRDYYESSTGPGRFVLHVTQPNISVTAAYSGFVEGFWK